MPTLYDFIDNNLKLRSNYSSSLKELQKFTTFLSSNNYILDANTLIELVENSSLLRTLLGNIVSSDNNLVWTNNLDDLFNDEILLSLIDAYCLINNTYQDDYIIFGKKLLNTSFDLYMKDLNALDLDTYDDIKLLEEIKKGNQEAKKLLVEKYLKLVINIARRYYNSRCDYLDIIAEGNLGLMLAIQRFDVNRGCKFFTYAYCSIKSRMQDFVSTYGVTESLDYLMANNLIDSEKYLEDTYDLDVTDEYFLRSEVEEFLNSLNLKEIEKIVISLNFGMNGNEPQSLFAIAKRYRLTRERVRQIYLSALKKMIYSSKINSFSVYMNQPEKCLETLEKTRIFYLDRRNKFKKIPSKE